MADSVIWPEVVLPVSLEWLEEQMWLQELRQRVLLQSIERNTRSFLKVIDVA